MFAATAMPAFAEPPKQEPVSDTYSVLGENSGTFTLDGTQLTPQQRESLAALDSLQIGDSFEIGKLGGDTLYAIVADGFDGDLTRGINTSSSRTINVTYQDMWGNTKTAFSVRLTCKWYKDAENSYITNLSGTYTVYDSSFRCRWGKDAGSITEPTYFALFLLVSHNFQEISVTCAAVCNTNPERPSIEFYLN